MHASRPRVAVVGHIEWVQFGSVERVPRAGEVVHASDPFQEPAGGGAVAAVQLARLAGESLLLTALGDDEHGRRSVARLEELGVRVRAALRAAPTRTAVTLLDETGERTIVTLGARLEPEGTDVELHWDELAGMDAVYFTAGDAGALRAARAARALVASPRARLQTTEGVRLDALVLSAEDALELDEAARAPGQAELVVLTDGERGGTWRDRSGRTGAWEPAPLPGARADAYGCGDSFAAGFTYGLGAGMTVPAALDLAARCGAACLAGRGPYGRQLGDEDLRGAAAGAEHLTTRSRGER